MSNTGIQRHIRLCTRVYAVMMSLTVVTFLLGQTGLDGLPVALGVLIIALVKGQLVGAYFMELGPLRGFWRWPVLIWLFIPGTLIGTAFYLA